MGRGFGGKKDQSSRSSVITRVSLGIAEKGLAWAKLERTVRARLEPSDKEVRRPALARIPHAAPNRGHPPLGQAGP